MPITPPAAAQPAAEPVPYLLRFKTSLVKRWSHTRTRELFQECDLATYLWALNREAEALEILDSITTAIPASKGDYNIWTPVVRMHALQARILRTPTGSSHTRNVNAVLADPGLADNPPAIASSIPEAEAAFQAATGRSLASSCRNHSRALGRLFLLSELARAHHPFAAYFSPSTLDDLIPAGRESLATRLTP
ncbi:hypothetical protein [Actinomadura harenae]|uniref:Uncharacterized protein n=1 Tax=Actinomadura harenae TaxID=2483351 RepID=A0A3M2LKY3_9ACTN|nr:hypothetical protein [Actinomadura harenae]RMI38051.1 hypothetical protein EBO15_34025 [Actinomadura harenae]